LGGEAAKQREADLSFEMAIVLLITYRLGLVFTLKTHKDFFAGHTSEVHDVGKNHHIPWSTAKSLAVLAVSTALIAWMSEILVGSVEPAAEALGFSSLFVGVIVVAIIGNAAEHSTAVIVANEISRDGESNWLEGAQLLMVSILFAIVFYFLPEASAKGAPSF
jgi:Ca2+:H+ antiporter